MKHHFRIYLRLLKLNFAALTSYRANFLNNVFSSILWGSFQMITILIITSRVTTVFGWSRNELIFLVALLNIFVGIYHFLFSRNFERFSNVVNLGQLDSILLKPVDSQFLLSFWLAGYANLLRIIIGVGFIYFIVKNNHIYISFQQIIGGMCLMAIGLITLYSIWFTIMTLTIWFTKLSNLADLMYTSNSFARLPREAINGIKDIAIYLILPLTLIVSTPAKLLLGKPYQTDLLLLLAIAFSLFVISRKFWKFALRFYTSASS